MKNFKHIKNHLLIFFVSALLVSCKQQNDERDIIYSDLPYASLDNGLWQSNPWDENWLSFPSQSSVEILHDLGQIPTLALPYISFHVDGQSNALASGDLARIVDINETTITFKNNTGEDFFLRVVLQL